MNPRFSDYVTSGAFALQLTRSQIATLSMVAGGHFPLMSGALERKGLCEVIPGPDGERPEVRLTGAGALCLALLAEAGLVNSGRDALAGEVEDLRAHLAAARREMAEARLKARAALARKDEMARDLAEARGALAAATAGVRLKEEFRDRSAPVVRLRDPLPDLADADLLGGES